MSKPFRVDINALSDYVKVISLLILVILLSVFIGLHLSNDLLSSWGQWLGAFIAGIAMVASSYAIVIQARQGESTGWNIAMTRLGEIYDQASSNPRFASIISQTADPDWLIDIDPDDIDLSATENVWLASLFLAFEQIFVASKGLSGESRRVWRLYISNMLNKPYIRATFVKDAVETKDYHQDFWRFVRGYPDKKSPVGYKNYCIHPKYFNLTDQKKSAYYIEKELISKAYTSEDALFWMELFNDDEVKKQMYALPNLSIHDFSSQLLKRKVFTLFIENERVGGFTITKEKDNLATFGIVIAPKYRGRGLAKKMIKLLENEAKIMGVLTLRADVYADNIPSITALTSSGFRKFIWLEKNI